MNKKIEEISDSELRAACAEKAGWYVEYEASRNRTWLYNPNKRKITHDFGKAELSDFVSIPDYQNDRVALYDLIKSIPEERIVKFIDILTSIIEEQIGYSGVDDVPRLLWSFMTIEPIVVMRAYLQAME